MYFALANLTDSTAAVRAVPDPWTKVNPSVLPATKDEYKDWCKNPSTQDCFISGFEGSSVTMRTGPNNPLFKMHALVVDYDTPVSPEQMERLKVARYADFCPSWAATTFSGHLRLIWDFEKPILITSNEHAKGFIDYLNKALKLGKWHAGLDASALGKPTQYYHVGREWVHLNPRETIRFDHLCLWSYEGSKDVKFSTNTNRPPMDKISAEVMSKYPGKWVGEFKEGARGVRFWDLTADNETGCVVRLDGMQCFTGNQPFVPWAQLFGQAWVDQFQASKIAAVLDKTVYDGKAFWMENETGKWEDMCTEVLSQRLRVQGFEQGRPRGRTYSDIDEMQSHIITKRRVVRALPFLFYPPGYIRYDGSPYLNISDVKALEPGAPVTELPMTWSQGKQFFPFIHEFLDTMFNAASETRRDNPQLIPLLAWIKYAYQNMYKLTPRLGQAIVLAGPMGKGKTLFVRRILGGLFGKEPSDAGSHLVEGLQWTDSILQSPIMFIDDQQALSNSQTLAKFSAALKKYVSSEMVNYNAKFKQTGQVPWFGRVVICCNTDSESLRILPNMDISNAKKISLFKTSDTRVKFATNDVVERTIRQELPFFARFLLDWEFPAECVADEARYGIVHYHHPDLMMEAQSHGTTGVVEDVLSLFLEMHKDKNPKLQYWEGTAMALYENLALVSSTIMKDIKYNAMTVALGHMQKNGRNLVRLTDKGRRSYSWRIGIDLRGERTVECLIEESSAATERTS